MISSMHIENFKCFKEFDIELGPLTVLIGPNDSGKTAFLQAIRLVADAGGWTSTKVQAAELSDRTRVPLGKEAHWGNDWDAQIKMVAYGAEPKTDPNAPRLLLTSKKGIFKCVSETGGHGVPGDTRPAGESLFRNLARELATACYYQFQPEALRSPSQLSETMDEAGKGFLAFLDDISRGDRPGFSELERDFHRRFPYYKTVIIDKDQLPDGKDVLVVRFRTVHDKTLSAEAVSDGVMLSLAFIALPHSLDPPKLLLIEEPENGVHYASLKEIVETLRELSQSKDVQVILTTHSPYLLDLVEPEDVRVFNKDREGAVHAMKMSDAPDVEELRKHFMTGEIWTVETEPNLVAKGRGKK